MISLVTSVLCGRYLRIRCWYPPPTFDFSVNPVLRYNITEVTNGSETLGVDSIIRHMENRIKELSTDNLTIINQIAPVMLNGMNGFKISYYQKEPQVQVKEPIVEEAVQAVESTPSTRTTEVVVAGNERIYEISYTVPFSFQFIETPEIEGIIEKTQFSAPFKPVEFSPEFPLDQPKKR